MCFLVLFKLFVYLRAALQLCGCSCAAQCCIELLCSFGFGCFWLKYISMDFPVDLFGRLAGFVDRDTLCRLAKVSPALLAVAEAEDDKRTAEDLNEIDNSFVLNLSADEYDDHYWQHQRNM